MVAPDVRAHLLEVGHALFLRHGFTAVGLAELLAAAGVPKGSFYHYFGSKEAFGAEVIDAYFAGYLAEMDEVLARPGTAAQQLIAYFRDWRRSQTGTAASRCLVVKLGAEVCDLSERMRAALDRGTRQVVERIARRIAAGREDGSLVGAPAARPTAALLYQCWLGAGLLAKITHDPAPLDAAMRQTQQVLGLPVRAVR